MYPKTGVTIDAATELKVNADRRTKASIGKFGEEDLFKFTVKTDGRYVIDTKGPRDIVMKLFGPGNSTALIDEDDDSGIDTNAKIAANLITGESTLYRCGISIVQVGSGTTLSECSTHELMTS